MIHIDVSAASRSMPSRNLTTGGDGPNTLDVSQKVTMIETERTKLRWPLILGVTLFGIVIVAAPYLLARMINPGFGDWRSLTSSTLTNVGSAVLLAALLFVLERGFVARVTDAATKTADRIVEERTRDLVDSNDQMRQQLAALQQQVDERSASSEAAGAAAAARISENVSYDVVAGALELANDINALWHGDLAVPATNPTDGSVVRLSWRFQQIGYVDPSLYPVLQLEYRSAGSAIPIMWVPEQSAAEAIHELRESMIAAGLGAEARRLDAEHMFKMFQIGIADAIAGRRHVDGSWVLGRMDELVSPDLAVTDVGLVARNHGIAVESRDFPAPPDPFVRREPGQAVPETQTAEFPVPVDVSPDDWPIAVEHATRMHPPRMYPFLSGAAVGPTGIEITSENTPRQQS